MQCNDIIASAKSSNSQIDQVLVFLNKTKETIAQGKELVNLLKKNKYDESFVEISENHIKEYS